jgi:hypothetical protein
MPSPKANILVAFYSRDGSVEALAKAVSEGAREAGAEIRLRSPTRSGFDGCNGQGSRLGRTGQANARRVRSSNACRRRVGRWDHIWHPDAFWEHVGGIKGIHRQPWWSVVSREAKRKSGCRLHFHGRTARWKRDDRSVAVHPDGSPRIHHRAERLHSRKNCSGTWNAIRFVVDFRTAQRQADCGRACGREASGCTRDAGGRSSEGRTLKLDVTCCNQALALIDPVTGVLSVIENYRQSSVMPHGLIPCSQQLRNKVPLRAILPSMNGNDHPL